MVRSASTVASAASSPTADGTEAVEVNTVKENSTIVLRDLEDHVVEAEDVGESAYISYGIPFPIILSRSESGTETDDAWFC